MCYEGQLVPKSPNGNRGLPPTGISGMSVFAFIAPVVPDRGQRPLAVCLAVGEPRHSRRARLGLRQSAMRRRATRQPGSCRDAIVSQSSHFGSLRSPGSKG